jgi:uncharacterized protein (TIGR02594 family)
VIGTSDEAIPKWLTWALGQLGVKEVPGARDNPVIVGYHAETAAGPAPDELAWCSSFVNAAMKAAGLRGTRNKAASSWLRWGLPSVLRIGGVAFFGQSDPDAKGTGHVFIVFAWDEQWVWGVGGNQQNQVSVARRPRSALEACRWPAGVP